MKQEININSVQSLQLKQVLSHAYTKEPLKSWLPINASPLLPRAHYLAHSCIVHVLFAIDTSTSKSEAKFKPWGVVSWLQANGKLLSLQNISILGSEDYPRFTEADLCKHDQCDLFDEEQNIQFLGSKPLDDFYKKLIHKLGWIKDLELITTKQTLNQSSNSPEVDKEKTTALSTLATPNLTTSDSVQVSKERRKTLINLMLGLMKLDHEMVGSNLQQTFHQLKAMIAKEKFSIVIAGEFSRGKSTLINRLLEEEVLPVGDLPTSATLTSIIYGSALRYVFVRTNKEVMSCDNLEMFWDLIEINHDDDHHVVKGSAQVALPLPWLKANKIEIIDTPGAGELSDERANLALDAIASCDATVIVISATMPLSMTEAYFIEHKVLISSVPKMAVVITKLDLIQENQRDKVLNHIIHRVHEISKSVQIWTTTELDYQTNVDCAGMTRIKEALIHWSKDSSHYELVSHRLFKYLDSISKQMSEHLKQFEEILLQKIQGNEVEQTKRLEQLTEKAQDWHKHEIKIQYSKENLNIRLEQVVNQGFSKLLASLHHQIEQTGNLKSWLANEAKSLIQGRLKDISESLSQFVIQTIKNDYKIICEGILKDFQHVKTDSNIEGNSTEVSEQTLMYLERFEATNPLINKLGLGVGAMVLPKILLAGTGPIGLIASLGLAFGGRILADRNTQAEKDQAKIEISKSMDMAQLEVLSHLRSTIERVYQEISADLEEMQSTWKRDQRLLIEEATRSQFPEKDCQILETQQKELHLYHQQLKEVYS
jgi:GTPase SAR1 family protein